MIAELTSDENESIEMKSSEISTTVYLYNTLVLSYLVLLGVLGHGMYVYYLKQKRIHGNKLNIVSMMLDSHKCKNI